MAYDAATGQELLFGGDPNDADKADTWEWNGGTWTELFPAASPPGTDQNPMAYDAATGQLILFTSGDQNSPSQTWNWTGTNWVNLSPPSSPSGRAYATMAYDAMTKQLLLFGGGANNAYLGDTWKWTGTTWVQLAPTSSPSPRGGQSMAYDPASGQLILFGGVSPVFHSDTWNWDGSNWVQQSPASSPPPLGNQAMDYDPNGSQIILFGGRLDAHPGDNTNDTWAWNGTTWQHLAPTSSPSPRSALGLNFDAATNNLLLFGGVQDPTGTVLGDTWTFSGGNWSPTAPPPRAEASMAYDPATGQELLFGGWNGSAALGDTWSWSAKGWTRLSPTSSPPPGGEDSMAYDAATNQLILLTAAGDSPATSTTWDWTGSNWTQLATSTSPSRGDSSIAYDPATRQLLLFGGGFNNQYLGNTWTWNGTDWVQLSPVSSPSPRVSAGMTYDPSSGQLLLFGGSNATSFFNDTWSWSGTNWVQLSPATSPPARGAAAMAFDPVSSDVLLFGGQTGPSSPSPVDANDTWAWDGSTWRQLAPLLSPSPRSFMAAGLDGATETILVVGGLNDSTGGVFGDAWTWVYGAAANSPSQLVASGSVIVGQAAGTTTGPTSGQIATFTDGSAPSPPPVYTAGVTDWGDGSGGSPATNQAKSGGVYGVNASHSYSTPGIYNVSVEVSGPGSSKTVPATAVVSDGPCVAPSVPIYAPQPASGAEGRALAYRLRAFLSVRPFLPAGIWLRLVQSATQTLNQHRYDSTYTTALFSQLGAQDTVQLLRAFVAISGVSGFSSLIQPFDEGFSTADRASSSPMSTKPSQLELNVFGVLGGDTFTLANLMAAGSLAPFSPTFLELAGEHALGSELFDTGGTHLLFTPHNGDPSLLILPAVSCNEHASGLLLRDAASDPKLLDQYNVTNPSPEYSPCPSPFPTRLNEPPSLCPNPDRTAPIRRLLSAGLVRDTFAYSSQVKDSQCTTEDTEAQCAENRIFPLVGHNRKEVCTVAGVQDLCLWDDSWNAPVVAAFHHDFAYFAVQSQLLNNTATPAVVQLFRGLEGGPGLFTPSTGLVLFDPNGYQLVMRLIEQGLSSMLSAVVQQYPQEDWLNPGTKVNSPRYYLGVWAEETGVMFGASNQQAEREALCTGLYAQQQLALANLVIGIALGVAGLLPLPVAPIGALLLGSTGVAVGIISGRVDFVGDSIIAQSQYEKDALGDAVKFGIVLLFEIQALPPAPAGESTLDYFTAVAGAKSSMNLNIILQDQRYTDLVSSMLSKIELQAHMNFLPAGDTSSC